jgi:putative colanic acid biosynthesis acetyltransferase WcaF
MTSKQTTAGYRRESFPVTFSFRERTLRILWKLIWGLLASWTPRPLNRWRLFLLRSFGAKIASTAVVYGSVRVWWPGNLEMEARTTLGPRSVCYNMAPILVQEGALISQDAQLCTGTHVIDGVGFELIAKPITIGPRAWIAASAFVGPGVVVEEGAVLGACGVAFSILPSWTVWAGNPARQFRRRKETERPQP